MVVLAYSGTTGLEVHYGTPNQIKDMVLRLGVVEKEDTLAFLEESKPGDCLAIRLHGDWLSDQPHALLVNGYLDLGI